MFKLTNIRSGHRLQSAAGAGLVVLAGLVTLITPLGESLVNWSYDSTFWFRPDIPVEDVAIIYMDDESHRQLHQPSHERWDRGLHARLLERLTRLGARVIAFDVLFAGETEPEADAALVRATKSHGRVAVATVMSPILTQGELAGWQPIKAFPALAEAAATGVVEESGAEKAVRRHYWNTHYTNEISLASRVVQLTKGRSPPLRERWINYYGPPGFLPHLSYFDVFGTNAETAAMLSNKVVFVGALSSVAFTGGKSTDDFRNPYTLWTGRLSPGVEINATAYLNLARGDGLKRLAPAIEFGIVALLGILVGVGLMALHPFPATAFGITASALLGAVAILLTWQTHVWFPWLIVSSVQIPLALGCSVLINSRRLAREKRAYEQALALANKGDLPTASSDAGSDPAAVVRSLGKSLSDSPSPFASLFIRASDANAPSFIPDHELIRCIGRGAYGQVWLARDIIGSFHAVKLIRFQESKDNAPLGREFEGLSKFTPISRSHPGFVHILHVGSNEKERCLYYVMELADDETTGQQIRAENYSPRTLAAEIFRRGRLPLKEVLHIVIRLADALEVLHQNQLIHRDIKPANILFVKGAPKLADIGLVTDMAGERRDASYLGTPGRMAPEGAGTAAADVYGLGKVLYEAGLGMDVSRFPELPSTMIESGDDRGLFELNRVIMRACEVDARRRLQSAAELRDQLTALHERLFARQP